jgi:hypothetical protein
MKMIAFWYIELCSLKVDCFKGAYCLHLEIAQTLEDLDYADDIYLLSHRWRDMQEKLNDVNYESKKIGLHINLAKTGDEN